MDFDKQQAGHRMSTFIHFIDFLNILTFTNFPHTAAVADMLCTSVISRVREFFFSSYSLPLVLPCQLLAFYYKCISDSSKWNCQGTSLGSWTRKSMQRDILYHNGEYVYVCVCACVFLYSFHFGPYLSVSVRWLNGCISVELIYIQTD